MPSNITSTAGSKVISYLLGLQQPDGNFRSATQPHTAETELRLTYHAVRTLHLLQQDIPRKNEVIGIAAQALGSIQPSLRYYAAFILGTLIPGFSPPSNWSAEINAWPVSIIPAPDSAGLNGWLTWCKEIIAIKQAFSRFDDQTALRDLLLRLQRPQGGFGASPNLEDTCIALECLARCNPELPGLEPTRLFVDRLQSVFNGFATGSNAALGRVESIHAGLRCCQLLRLPLRYPLQTRQLLLDHQMASGGFSGSAPGEASIVATHRAMQGLFLLDLCPD